MAVTAATRLLWTGHSLPTSKNWKGEGSVFGEWYVAPHQQKWIHPYSVTGENLIAKVPWRGSNRISSRSKKWQSTDQCIQRRSCCPKVPHNLPHDSHGWPWWVSHASRKFWRKHEEMNGNDVNTHNQFPNSLDERCARVKGFLERLFWSDSTPSLKLT